MSLLQHLKEGLDPTGQTCISFADLLQMIRNAMPWPKQGFVVFQATAPNVILYPEMAYFLWVRTVDDVNYVPVSPTEIYYYNGTYWIDLTKMDGSRLIPASVALTALTLAGSSPLDIIHVNAVGNALEYVSIPTAIQTDTIPVDRLVAPDVINNYVLTCFAGTKTFQSLAAFFSAITDNLIPVNKLALAGADALGFYLRTKLDGSAIEWANVDVANIAAATSSGAQSIRRKADNSGWEYYIPAVSSYPTMLPPTNCTGGLVVNTSAGWQTVNATLFGVPLAAHHVMLQVEVIQTITTPGNSRTEYRKNSGDAARLLCFCGSGDGAGGNGFGICELDAGKFDYNMLSTTTTNTYDLKIVGYFM